jgi:hypothetical protein
MAIFKILNFTLGMFRFGLLKESSSEELTKFVQLLIAFLVKGIQVDYGVSTSHIRIMSRG